MEEWKDRTGAYLAKSVLIISLVVFVLAGWMLVVDFLYGAVLITGLSPESRGNVFYSLMLASFVIVSLHAIRKLRTLIDWNALLMVLIVCIAFLGMRAHRYVFYWDWERNCANGQMLDCWALANAHRQESGFGMRSSKAAYYENQACELGWEFGCVAMIRRGETDFSQSMCEVMSWNCQAQKDSEIFVEERDLMCFAVETHCQKHLRPE